MPFFPGFVPASLCHTAQLEPDRFPSSAVDQACAKILDVVAKELSGKNRVPTFILRDAKSALVEAIAYGRAAKVIVLP